jgi:hypothetical protein
MKLIRTRTYPCLIHSRLLALYNTLLPPISRTPLPPPLHPHHLPVPPHPVPTPVVRTGYSLLWLSYYALFILITYPFLPIWYPLRYPIVPHLPFSSGFVTTLTSPPSLRTYPLQYYSVFSDSIGKIDVANKIHIFWGYAWSIRCNYVLGHRRGMVFKYMYLHSSLISAINKHMRYLRSLLRVQSTH